MKRRLIVILTLIIIIIVLPLGISSYCLRPGYDQNIDTERKEIDPWAATKLEVGFDTTPSRREVVRCAVYSDTTEFDIDSVILDCYIGHIDHYDFLENRVEAVFFMLTTIEEINSREIFMSIDEMYSLPDIIILETIKAKEFFASKYGAVRRNANKKGYAYHEYFTIPAIVFAESEGFFNLAIVGARSEINTDKYETETTEYYFCHMASTAYSYRINYRILDNGKIKLSNGGVSEI
ncbi:MAG: hypothetical protein LBE09_04090 [Christensenellaceae bacterium]|jgi:hypothetical protein|nr:hypothetical protein [Christensenellaceae bacterium]